MSASEPRIRVAPASLVWISAAAFFAVANAAFGGTDDVAAVGYVFSSNSDWTYCNGVDGGGQSALHINFEQDVDGPLWSLDRRDLRLEGRFHGHLRGLINVDPKSLKGYVVDDITITDFAEPHPVKARLLWEALADGAAGARGFLSGDVCGARPLNDTRSDVCGAGRESIGKVTAYLSVANELAVFPHAIFSNPTRPIPPQVPPVDPGGPALIKIGGPSPLQPFDTAVIQTGSCLSDPPQGLR